MAYIGNIPAEKFTSVDIQNFTVSATANYTLDRPVANENEIELFINNVRQHPGSGKAYTASGTALTLSEATAGTDTMYCVYQGKARQTVTPATSSVTNAMLAGSIDLTSKVTGALPQANIADQAINEAKLQISNAPTNGYMLTAQSGNTGGLTWAEAPTSGLSAYWSVKRSGNFSVSQSTTTTVTFNVSTVAQNVTNTVSSDGRITIPSGQAGWYVIHAISRYADGPTDGKERVYIQHYDTSGSSEELIGYGELNTKGTYDTVDAHALAYLDVGDYVYVQVWQNNDSSANFIGSNGTGFMGYKIA
jgi:hypothetical protein